MKDKIILVMSTLFGLFFANAGVDKFFHYMPVPEMSASAGATFGAFVETGWLMPLVGVAELIAGVLIVWPKTSALGVIMMFPLTIGIFLLHAVQDPAGVAVGIVFLLINLWLIYENRDKYLHMIG